MPKHLNTFPLWWQHMLPLNEMVQDLSALEEKKPFRNCRHLKLYPHFFVLFYFIFFILFSCVILKAECHLNAINHNQIRFGNAYYKINNIYRSMILKLLHKDY